MCESIFAHLLKKGGIENVDVASRGTSYEEYGNPVHSGTRRVLSESGIKTIDHRACSLVRKDIEEYDMFVCMDVLNLSACAGILGGYEKVSLLLSYVGEQRSVADPWYTGDFKTTFDDCYRGLIGLLEYLKKNGIV